MRPIRGYAFQEAMLFAAERSGARVVEHPIMFTERTTGSSKLRWDDIAEYFRFLFTTRRIRSMLPHPHGVTTWGRLPHAERRFALRLGIALVIITAAPYIYAWALTPAGHTYTGIHALIPGDMTVYTSYLNQVRDGAVLLTDQFTTEQPPRRFLDLFWLGAGLFARTTRLPSVVAFHALRLLLIVPFTMLLAVCVASFLRHPIAGWSVRTIQRTALLLITLGGGMGAYLAPVLKVRATFIGSEHWPPDLWMAEAYPFLSMLQSPHFIASTACIVALVLFLLRAQETRQWRWIVAIALLSAFFVEFHPFYAPLVAALPFTWAIVAAVAERRMPTRMLTAGIAAFVGTGIAAAYHLWLIMADPITAAHAQQNLLATPIWWIVAAGYGVLLPLAVIGLFYLFRCFDAPAQLLAVWLTTTSTLLFSPLPWQRRFAEGLFIVLVLIAIPGIFVFLQWLRTQLPHIAFRFAWSRAAAVMIAIPLFAFSTLYNVIRDGYLFTATDVPGVPRHAVYFPNAAIAAMRWTESHADPTDTALGLNLTGPFIPMFTHLHTVVGHGVATVDYTEKTRVAYGIADGSIPAADALTFLRQQRTRYIIVTDDDRRYWTRRPDELPGVRLAFQNEQAEVYEVGGQ